MLLTDELLLQYKRCYRRAFLNVYGEDSQKQSEKDFIFKLKEEKEFHSKKVLESYNLPYQQPRLLLKNQEDNNELISITENLMRQGVDCIYDGMIRYNFSFDTGEEIIFIASPTLLIKQNIPSRWGDWCYIPANTHLGKNMKPEYKLISAFHGDILRHLQGVNFPYAHLFLRYRYQPYFLNLDSWIPVSRELVNECLSMLIKQEIPEVFLSRQKCSLCQWYDSCHQVAKDTKHLSLIPGITPKRYELLREIGINNLTSLFDSNFGDLKGILGEEIATNIYRQAKSLFLSQPVLKQSFFSPIPSHNIELYFDIEAEPDRNLDYLLGVLLINYDTKEEKYYQFLAENQEEEGLMWQNFLHFINQYPESPIFHYSNYEVETVKRLGHLYRTSSDILQPLLTRLFDIHKFLINSLFLPVESYSLKSVGKWLNFQWRDPKTGKACFNYNNISGDQCVVWYDRWLKTFDRTWLDYILIYNEDDCIATYELKKWLQEYQNKLSFFDEE